MRQLLALVCVLSLAPLSGCTPAEASPRQLVAQVATAARPSSLSTPAYNIILNGELSKLGVLASTGTTVNNSTTSTPFTVTTNDCPSRVLMLDCDGAGNIGNGTTCSDTITNASYKPQTGAHEWRYFTLDSNSAAATTLICLDTAGTTVNCAVFCML